MEPTAPDHDRILILAPTGRDAELALAALANAGLTAEIVRDVDELCARIREGCGAVMLTDEALDTRAMDCLREELEKQPAWSDLSLMIFTSRPAVELTVRSFEQLGERANVTLIERPIRVRTMTAAAEAALRARRRQYEVRCLVDELERRVRERDNFLAMLSHELRNPLTAISLAVDTLGGTKSLSNEHEILIRQTRHLAKLVDDLLDIARVTTGKIALHVLPIDLRDVIEHCVETMRPRADARRLRLTVHLDVARVVVRGDPVRLEQIVNNLLVNAVKYTQPGGEIDVHLESAGDEAVLRVRDNGKGIPEEMLTRVFDLFMQGDTTIDRAEGGMGVGLTLVKKLVTLHKGTVSVDSAGRGSGSEFTVRLPLTADAVLHPRHSRAIATGARRRIVVVEDNQDIRDLLRIKLQQLGHTIDTAEDGPEGLELLVSSRPEIALIDIGLPGLSGYEVARRAREALGAGVYLVALTGYGQAEDKDRALEAGFDIHLTKPPDFIDLQNVLAAAGDGVRDVPAATDGC